MKSENIIVPGFLPDVECVRNDIMDYFFEVERFDRDCGNIIRLLEKSGELENTIIVMTSDNGMPFPRAKANLYDYGTRMPLVIYWNGKSKGARMKEFINFVDFGPTFLEAAGIDIPASFSGNSLVPIINGQTENRSRVYLERERHANVRKGDLSYPSRAIRTNEFLYIRNFEPDRWPAGNPETHQSVGQYGDIDNSISKFLIMDLKDDEERDQKEVDFFELAIAKRPSEELYILANDPYNLKNEVSNHKYETILEELRDDLMSWMESTNDIRFTDPQTIYWDTVEYTPDYQRANFDLDQRIANYKMARSVNYGRFEEIPCK